MWGCAGPWGLQGKWSGPTLGGAGGQAEITLSGACGVLQGVAGRSDTGPYLPEGRGQGGVGGDMGWHQELASSLDSQGEKVTVQSLGTGPTDPRLLKSGTGGP